MRLGWGWKLFGVVIFQLGLSSLGVTYKSHQKGAVLVFFLKQQKKGRWDSQTDRLLQRVKEWATASVSEWVNGLLSEGQITCLLPDRGKLPRSALIAATRTSSLCRRCLHQPAGHSQALDYSPAWLHLWEDILSDTMLVFEVQKQQQMLFFSPFSLIWHFEGRYLNAILSLKKFQWLLFRSEYVLHINEWKKIPEITQLIFKCVKGSYNGRIMFYIRVYTRGMSNWS